MNTKSKPIQSKKPTVPHLSHLTASEQEEDETFAERRYSHRSAVSSKQSQPSTTGSSIADTLPAENDQETGFQRHKQKYLDLVLAYENAKYRIMTEEPFTMRIGVYSDRLAALMKAAGANCASLITSDNPFSHLRNEEENREARNALHARLTEHRKKLVPAIGIDPEGSWPGEEGYLVLDLNVDSTKALACMFDQNAFVFAASDAVPVVVLLRSPEDRPA